MKILLATNKTYAGHVDLGHWYTYKPLVELGHNVYWHDTVKPEVQDFGKVIEHFKPDLIFCCITGNPALTPAEPSVWEAVKKETNSGRTKTFNWFCDDTWRFHGAGGSDVGSSTVCHNFTACSTPEPTYIQKYKDAGYNNIILGAWHANSEYYIPVGFDEKNIDVSFIGRLNPTRKSFFSSVENEIQIINGISNEEMFSTHCNTKIGINLSVNDNDPQKKTQMKQRPFEIVAGGALLMTEYHEGIEEFFRIDKEIITFKSVDEFSSKLEFLRKNQHIARNIASKGYERFLRDHDSKKRLKNLLERIGEF